MTSHELAKRLLEMPDLPVTISRGVHCSYETMEDTEDVSMYPANPETKREEEFYPTDHIHIR